MWRNSLKILSLCHCCRYIYHAKTFQIEDKNWRAMNTHWKGGRKKREIYLEKPYTRWLLKIWQKSNSLSHKLVGYCFGFSVYLMEFDLNSHFVFFPLSVALFLSLSFSLPIITFCTAWPLICPFFCLFFCWVSHTSKQIAHIALYTHIVHDKRVRQTLVFIFWGSSKVKAQYMFKTDISGEFFQCCSLFAQYILEAHVLVGEIFDAESTHEHITIHTCAEKENLHEKKMKMWKTMEKENIGKRMLKAIRMKTYDSEMVENPSFYTFKIGNIRIARHFIRSLQIRFGSWLLIRSNDERFSLPSIPFEIAWIHRGNRWSNFKQEKMA